MLRSLFSLLFLLVAGLCLECYTGYSIMKGGKIGSETKHCGKDTDFCYNASARVHDMFELQKAGCNTLICQYNGNKCFQEVIAGKPVTFCCCNTGDMCNGGHMVEGGSFLERGISMAKGIAQFLGR